jgi:DNA-binding transcriptional ArsR family regulator
MQRRSAAVLDLARASPVFAALGDHTRLALVVRLCQGGPRSIAGLTEGSRITRQAVTKHLQVLADAGLVQGARRGRERIWELSPNGLGEARRSLDELSRRWDQALDRLRAWVEEGSAPAVRPQKRVRTASTTRQASSTT